MQNYQTGLFINYDKSMMLLRFVRSVMQTDFNYLVACGPKNAQNACELILQNISNKNNSDFLGAKDLLTKYIDILECYSGASYKSSSTTSGVSDNNESQQKSSTSSVKSKTYLENTKMPVDAALGKANHLEVIDLDDTVCNDETVIILDDSNVDELNKLKDNPKDLNNSSIYFIDKLLSSFESPDSKSTKKRKRLKTNSSDKIKRTKKITIAGIKGESTSNTGKNKEILKELNGQDNATTVNIADVSDSLDIRNRGIPSQASKVAKPHPSKNIVQNFKTINLVDDCSDDDVVVLDETIDNDIIVIDSPGSPLRSAEVTSSNFPKLTKHKKIKCKKLLKAVQKSEKLASLKKCKKFSPTTSNIVSKRKKGSKHLFKVWSRPAHLSPQLTKRPLAGSSSSAGSGSSECSVGSNIYNPNINEKKKEGLRPVIIDGSNVAIGHGKGSFSVRGLQICIDYFLKRGHRDVKVFVPQFRINSSNYDELDRMEKSGTLILTPSRRVEGKLVVPYDDRFIIQYAAETNGVVVSSDNYRDLYNENTAWKETIEKRLLMFTWVGDVLMFPQDPLGRNGPTLDEFLRF